ncbi:hypothetical protein K443DRAFT_680814 [Laccaria amethystina LaAM-08-1]|uniref:Uncharacterized protein n=1 Tax=Laccaria amethystina LaAM-08-1 TaxID=1095629 RepID=A0A0C9WMQ3_9AGAR|nr:hypothetical protein K443DRAFT_680814 [Laccaria amethystina LaAM-08-1]
MDVPLTPLSTALTTMNTTLTTVNTTLVHPVYFPYLLAPTLHAARISIAFQLAARKSPAPLSWGTYIVGYLITCWAGGLLSHFLLGLPPPMLYSFDPYITYITVHLVSTLLFTLFPFLLSSPILIDTLLFPLDALLRANTVSLTLAHLSLSSSSRIPLQYALSPFSHLLFGSIAVASGGIALSTFSLASSQWSLSTPHVLKSTAGLWDSTDVWAGALAAYIHGSTTHHPAFTFDSTSKLQYPSAILGGHLPFDAQTAKSLTASVLVAIYATRVVAVHYLPLWKSSAKTKTKNGVSAKKKTQ